MNPNEHKWLNFAFVLGFGAILFALLLHRRILNKFGYELEITSVERDGTGAVVNLYGLQGQALTARISGLESIQKWEEDRKNYLHADTGKDRRILMLKGIEVDSNTNANRDVYCIYAEGKDGQYHCQRITDPNNFFKDIDTSKMSIEDGECITVERNVTFINKALDEMEKNHKVRADKQSISDGRLTYALDANKMSGIVAGIAGLFLSGIGKMAGGSIASSLSYSAMNRLDLFGKLLQKCPWLQKIAGDGGAAPQLGGGAPQRRRGRRPFAAPAA